MISMVISCPTDSSQRGSRGAACRCGTNWSLLLFMILDLGISWAMWELLVVIFLDFGFLVYGAELAALDFAFHIGVFQILFFHLLKPRKLPCDSKRCPALFYYYSACMLVL